MLPAPRRAAFRPLISIQAIQRPEGRSTGNANPNRVFPTWTSEFSDAAQIAAGQTCGMSSPRLAIGRTSERGRTYSVTTICHRRQPLLLDALAAEIVINELRRLQQDGVVENFAWVLMPDHLHWLFSLRSGSLARCLQLLKGRSAHAINRQRDRSETVWQPGYHDHALRHEDATRQLAENIVLNPVRAGLVARVDDYAHCWCAWNLTKV